jgi:hypothetical protein
VSIVNLLNQIKNEEIVLPAIQRDFVWPEDKVLRLLDSIMRGYPIGIALLWETYEDIQYRSFSKDHRADGLHTFQENPKRKKLKLVLDGQQRLQSLYIALYGTMEGQSLYFDVLSGHDSDDLTDEKYLFVFATSKVAEARNLETRQAASKGEIVDQEDRRLRYLIRVSDLFDMGAKEKKDLVKELTKALNLPDDDQIRLDVNLSTFDGAMSKDENILKVSIIDENLPAHSPYRKSEADVLEIFVRVNREGTPLSRSDLIFSMLKLNWKESAQALPGFVRGINQGNSFELDADFIIRCLFAVSDLGTKFDLDLLRKKSNVAKLRASFQQCCQAIRATVDFVQKECWCSSSRVIGGAYTMVPFVYYFFHAKNHEILSDYVINARKALYLFGFSRPFRAMPTAGLAHSFGRCCAPWQAERMSPSH